MTEKSYSQRGEDILIKKLFEEFGIYRPNYIDIGASHPTKLSNTYLFYEKGARGVCVDGDKENIIKLKKERSRDSIILGVVNNSGKSYEHFYEFSNHTRSTVNKQTLVNLEKIRGGKIIDSYPVTCYAVNELFKIYGVPDLLCIDAEGDDEEIIKSIDFNMYRPKVMCIEIVDLELLKKKTIDVLDEKLINFLKSKNYYLISLTQCNGIFVDLKYWEQKIGINRKGVD
jgi:hypothetical protein